MIGDTAQLGNARVDIPITHPGWWKRIAATTAHLETHSQSKLEGGHQINHKVIEWYRRNACDQRCYLIGPRIAPILATLCQLTRVGSTFIPQNRIVATILLHSGISTAYTVVKAVSYTHLTLPTTPYV